MTPTPSGESVARVVPWPTVLPLAAAMAFADGFWVESLRGAVGAIERAQSPFESWWRESALALPIFVIAVVGAVALALRWFGAGPASARAVVLSGLVVALAGTVAGFLLLTASSMIDYHLQAAQLSTMSHSGHTCADGCLGQQLDATLLLQVKAIGFGGVLMLVTNVLVVGWLVGLNGGRLALTTSRRRGAAARFGSRADDLGLLVAVALVGAAVIHAVAVPEHLEEWGPAGIFFAVLAAVEIALAGTILARPKRPVLRLIAAASIAPLALWLYTRTAGLPFGPEAGVAERVGFADCAACALELTTLAVVLVLLRGASALRERPAVTPHARALAALSLVAVAAFGAAALTPGWFDGSDQIPRSTAE